MYGHKIFDPCHESPTISKIVSVIEILRAMGRPNSTHSTILSLRQHLLSTWHERLTENVESLMLRLLPDDLEPSTVEIIPYFTERFGNSSRIDYGTGRETNFAAWLYCLARMGIIKEED
ncbi:hypothetical protein J1N35_030349 [Gossypium stocksii]|uniref:Serine/threonine-protein phosphatase 2A activator n=1 Tax=Gossypium stocksii TaxID=47602 RepID=A0A9D3ZU32_9ROSI|nr:hypothetical protein J1N35_030349 [Gossypium stocksii]